MANGFQPRSLREIVRILFQHWFMMLFVIVLGTCGTYVACKLVVPTYRSKVSLMFKRPQNKSPISTDESERVLEVFVKAQHQIVMSDLVLARAMVISEDASLREAWYGLREAWASTRAAGVSQVARALENIGSFLREDVRPSVEELLFNAQDELGGFRDSVKLETPGGEQVAMAESFTLHVQRPSRRGEPESYRNAMYAADILADMYMVRYQELQQELHDPALRVMQDVIDAFELEVGVDIGKYKAFVEENSADIGVLEQLLKSGTEHGIQAVLTKVRENDARLAIDLARESAVYTAMRSALPLEAFEPGGVAKMTDEAVEGAVHGIPVEFLANDAGFGERLKELARLEAKRAEIEAQFTEASREVQYLREEIRMRNRQLLQAIVAHARGLAASVEARRLQKAMNEELVETTEQKQSRTHRKLAEYARLKNGFLAAQLLLEKLQQEKIDALSNRLRARESVTILKFDQASVPDRNRPVTPKTGVYSVVAFLVSLLLGIAGAFLADHFDHTLRSTGEAERYLGVPVLGSIKKRGRGLVVGA